MKKLLIRKKLLVLTCILSFVSLLSQAQNPVCPVENYEFETKKGLVSICDSLVLVELKDSTVVEFSPCSDPNAKKNITFIHGLGGDVGSWSKPKTWTDDNYEAAVIIGNYNGHGWESEFHSVAMQLNNQIGYGLASGIDNLYPNRCKANDFAIAHSQGGVASRYLDYQWDVNTNGTFGDRKFYGLVTFGTPHAGADVADTRDEHDTFVSQVVAAIFLKDIYSYKDWVPGADQMFNSVTDFIKDQLAPILLGGVHTPTLDEMKPESQTMETINNHGSRLRKVAFYGIEDAPECWRVLDDIVTKSASEYDLFTATEDETFLNKVLEIQHDHIAMIAENNLKIKRLVARNYMYGGLALANINSIACVLGIFYNLYKIDCLHTENDNRKTYGLDFLNNANTQWRFLIGSYAFETELNTCYKVTGVRPNPKKGLNYGVITDVFYFNTIEDAQDFSNQYSNQAGWLASVEKITSSRKVKKFYPSDGVVTMKSQLAFPGVGNRTDMMRGNSHFQERNSPETRRMMQNLYKGEYDFFFFTDEKN
jgi:pimeloyl-ACP methyl ester carboxylesterase